MVVVTRLFGFFLMVWWVFAESFFFFFFFLNLDFGSSGILVGSG